MFNLSGGEIVILLLLGLVVLGPEKLPDAMRKFGRVYNEVKRVAGGIQRDVSAGFADPVNELKKTANEARRFFTSDETGTSSVTGSGASDPVFVPYEAVNEAPSPQDPSEKMKDDDGGPQV